MNALFAVIDDLWMFVCESLFGSVVCASEKEIPKELPPAEIVDVYQEVITEHQIQSSDTGTGVHSLAFLHSGEQYFIGSIDTYVYVDPVIAFDNALQPLSYGQSVRLLQLQGRWAQVRFGECIGWVLKDTLCSARADVYPQFVQGKQYVHTDPETVKLRACINDAFGGARGEFSLTTEEYVHYKLHTKKRHLTWGEERSRIAGTWQRKLKGKQGVYIRVTPATDAVMEYVLDDVGHLAFVEAVYPDKSIKISEIQTEEGSMYKEQTLSTNEWREFRPVFITVA